MVAGAAGKMGKEVVKAISREKDLKLTAAVDHQAPGQDAGSVAGIEPLGIQISPPSPQAFQTGQHDVLVDFTKHESAMSNIKESVQHNVACVVGTTGFTENDYKTIQQWCQQHRTPVLIAPNFAIGAVLLMKFAQEASRYFDWSEIIEGHHEKKLDAPSGTALRTAQLMRENHPQPFGPRDDGEKISVEGSRGGNVGGIRIHSVRLPGFVAHQEVLFGNTGEILTLRHDSISRESFMPGVIMAVRRIINHQQLIIGLENIL